MTTETMRAKIDFNAYKIECIFYDDEKIEFIDDSFKMFFDNEMEVAKWTIEFCERHDELCEIKVTSCRNSENIIIWLGLY